VARPRMKQSAGRPMTFSKLRVPQNSRVLDEPQTTEPSTEWTLGKREWPACWLAVRLIVGVCWIEVSLPKLTDPGWMSTGLTLKGYLEKFVAVQNPPRPRMTLDVVAFDWYNAFLRHLLDTEAYVWLAKYIAIGELLIGFALVVGALVGVTAAFSLFTSLNLGLAGSARTNCFLLLLSLSLIYERQAAGAYGVDRWLLPRLHAMWRAAAHGLDQTARAITPTPAAQLLAAKAVAESSDQDDTRR
jgi:thiosulfate dehydrogenase [quinone] large subunit